MKEDDLQKTRLDLVLDNIELKTKNAEGGGR